jgi:hypothetical protein
VQSVNGNVKRYVIYTSHNRLQIDLLNITLWDTISYSVINRILYNASVSQTTRCHVPQSITFSVPNLFYLECQKPAHTSKCRPTKHSLARFQASAAVRVMSSLFRVVMQHVLAVLYPRFGTAYP